MARRGCYIAITEEGDVYGGQSMDLSRRSNQHKHSGKTVIDSHEVPSVNISRVERHLIGFLVAQANEEDFDCTNVKLR